MRVTVAIFGVTGLIMVLYGIVSAPAWAMSVFVGMLIIGACNKVLERFEDE